MIDVNLHLIKQIQEHAEENFPVEACGFLIGEGSKVDRILRAVNADGSKTTYRIDPEEYARVQKDHNIIGIYHSHTNGSLEFSESDRKQAWDNMYYLVMGLDESGLKGWTVYRVEEKKT